ncbi:hypothetical protein [Burkholderia ubonensis]|uniref:EF-hand domain-containing protein n=1 Tax=Burkholderia ubonensis TaxID=101571 RepID=A0ABD4E1I1_9BURK|nr:hypothetical protein [Burkholderia ubonensis]KVN83491.1 hypothetical protein WJ68_16400 [Burkholderia ubonensis]
MKSMHPASELLRDLLSPAAPAKGHGKGKGKALFDDASDDDTAGPADYASTDLRVKAAAIVQEWANTDPADLGEGESLADRLLMLVIGVIDVDKDGEISDDESQVAAVLLDYIWDYLNSKGVSDDDCSALLNDGDNDAAVRVKDLIADSVSSDDDAAGDDIDDFAFDDESQTAIFDSAAGEIIYDATYRRTAVVRGGKKVKINKRVSGNVRLSAKQKVAVKKMLRKSHSAAATLKRMKSMRKRAQSGM